MNKAKLRKIIQSDLFPFIILGIGLLLFHLLVPIPIADDTYFITTLEGIFDWSFFINRYNTWSSRLILDFLVVFFIKLPSIAWRIANSFIIVFLGISISKLFIKRNRQYRNWFLVALLFIFPYKLLTDSGWVTTSVIYTWPLAFSMYELVILKKIVKEEPIHVSEFIIAGLLLVIAANQEVICTILLIIFLSMAIYLKKRKRSHWFLFVVILVCIIGIALVFTTPGNAARRDSELKWFQDFDHISLIDKLEIGVSSTLARQIYTFNLIFIILALLLVIVVHSKYKNTLIRFYAVIPIAVALIFNNSFSLSERLFPNLTSFYYSVTKYGIITLNNFTSIKTYIPFFILYFTAFCIVILLYLTFENTSESLIAIGGFVLGFVSRMAVAFSPTIWASGIRTHTYFTYAILICSVLVFNKLDDEKPKKISQYLLIFTGILAFLRFTNLLMSM